MIFSVENPQRRMHPVHGQFMSLGGTQVLTTEEIRGWRMTKDLIRVAVNVVAERSSDGASGWECDDAAPSSLWMSAWSANNCCGSDFVSRKGEKFTRLDLEVLNDKMGAGSGGNGQCGGGNRSGGFRCCGGSGGKGGPYGGNRVGEGGVGSSRAIKGDVRLRDLGKGEVTLMRMKSASNTRG
ncbi:hypothetical protein HK102_013609 [Quaeritorhiza haematococci]|nr:hypothetical protein HK102_013609 [Quaeritorhiza haematococci]